MHIYRTKRGGILDRPGLDGERPESYLIAWERRAMISALEARLDRPANAENREFWVRGRNQT